VVGTEGAPTRRIGMRRGLWVLGVLAVVVAVLLIRWLRGFDWSNFFSAFKNVDWRWLAVSLVLLLLTYFVRALRWAVMLRPIRDKPGLWNITSATVIGFTSIVLLGRPGEIVRPYLISVKERVPFSSQMAAWFLERIFDLMSVLLIFGIALTRLPAGLHLNESLQWILKAGGYLAASLGALCIILLVAFRNFAVPAQRRILSGVTFLPEKVQARIAKILTAFVEGMKCTHNRRYLALIVGYTVLQWAIIVLGNYCLFRAVPATASFSVDNVMIFLGFAAFGSMVQLPGIGGGVQIASVVILTQLFHIHKEPATAIAVLIWLNSWVAIVPFGLAFAFHEGINWKKIRHIQEETTPVPPPTAHSLPPL
jgi:glycosyltransferase 2 family protein